MGCPVGRSRKYTPDSAKHFFFLASYVSSFYILHILHTMYYVVLQQSLFYSVSTTSQCLGKYGIASEVHLYLPTYIHTTVVARVHFRQGAYAVTGLPLEEMRPMLGALGAMQSRPQKGCRYIPGTRHCSGRGTSRRPKGSVYYISFLPERRLLLFF